MKKTSLNWVNLLFFILTPIAAISGIIWRYQVGTIPWQTWLLTFAMVYLTGFGITAGYHRLFSHKSFQASALSRFLLLIFGAATFEASALWWSSEHRYHHQFVDTDRDPYGINKGFWYAHIGWLVARTDARTDFANVADLKKDPLILWQHKYYLPLAIVTSFGLPMALGALWGDMWGAFFVAGFARIVFVQHWTWCINSVAHTFGNQPYSDRHTAKDNWFAALFTYGEGYHNFHHEFASDYRNGLKFYQFDPTKWLIWTLSRVGQASNLKRTDAARILEARILMDRKRVTQHWALNLEKFPKSVEAIDAALQHVQMAYQRLMTIKAEYKALKVSRMETLSTSIAQLKLDLRQAKSEFKASLARWKSLVKGPLYT